MAARNAHRRKIICTALSAAAVLAASQIVLADNFTWNGTGGNFWDLTTASWDNTTIPAAGVPWSNNPTTTTPNLALFNLATPPASITVNDTIFTGGLEFDTTGWNIASGTGSLSFGDVGTITLNTT